MQTRNKILDDVSKLMTNAMGVAQGAKDEAQNAVKGLVDRLLADRDLVTREEFEAVRAMAQKAREENDVLAARLAALEGRGAGTQTMGGMGQGPSGQAMGGMSQGPGGQTMGSMSQAFDEFGKAFKSMDDAFSASFGKGKGSSQATPHGTQTQGQSTDGPSTQWHDEAGHGQAQRSADGNQSQSQSQTGGGSQGQRQD